MPEICEIVMTSHYLLSKLKNKIITSIQVLSGRYTKKKLEGFDLIEKYTPLKIKNIDSKGKFLWFELESLNDKYNDSKESKENKKVYILNTFGMTGGWGFEKTDHNRVQISIKDDEKKIKLYYSDMRNFGTMKIIDDDKKLESKLKKLGRDLLKTNYKGKDFVIWMKDIKNHNQTLYELLMTQEAKGIGSGLGNYLVPEVLYHAKLSPHRKLKDLTDKEIETLGESVRYITKLCYYNNKVGYMEWFGDYIDKHKKGVDTGLYPNYHEDIDLKNAYFQFNVYGQEKDPKGNIVKRDKSSKDRTIHWVPNVQK
jgi:formamidopyrimidine-DNA glycosylase